jgi:ubiquinol-cytochrome c reductase cytochrome b subunit
VIDGAYKAPRELNFWSGVVLLLLVLALSLTGYLLPWDQKGYWATAVATNIAGITPLVGDAVQAIVVGGPEYGHHTLTRFFALHAGIIPGAIMGLIGAHVYLFRRHGLTPKEPRRRPDAAFWPDQVLRDAVVCLAVFVIILFFVFRYHGAPLDAPADPASSYDARPEWYFLFLFQLLKYFPEFVSAFVIPGLLMALLIIMPYVGRWQLGHRFNLAFLWATIGGAGLLTYLAINEDRNNPNYVASVKVAERDAERAVELAKGGIPVTGALTLLRSDPLTQGPKLFAQHCASCHRYEGHDGLGNQVKDEIAASDLKGFGSREWLAGFFDPEQIVSPTRWGATHFKDGDMVKWVKESAEFDAAQKKDLEKAIFALSAEAKLPAQKAVDARDAALIEEGKKLMNEPLLDCTSCHKFGEIDNSGDGPDLTGFASREWLTAFISDPAHARFFGDNNDRMPSFGPLKEKILTEKEIGLVADWLRGDWPRTDAKPSAQ